MDAERVLSELEAFKAGAAAERERIFRLVESRMIWLGAKKFRFIAGCIDLPKTAPLSTGEKKGSDKGTVSSLPEGS